MIADDNVVINPSKPLDSTELEIISLHKVLTECWRNKSFYKGGVIPKPLFRKYDHLGRHSTIIDEDRDLDAELGSIMEFTDPSLIPDELMFTHNLEALNSGIENHVGPKQKLSAKLKSMELREDNYKHEEFDHPHVEKVEMENLFNDDDYVVGDYKYSFCEEEDLDHEIEYKL
ncbi:hypothetical protein TpMuguga_04g00867 [Theileria parva strain Muguga]|uniref:Uncharacterized protein n=1 Tax=Theileria parva TaxID=5875 RepID=Q4N182_THEPA|nr:uncharacterized protein TpMuguga_04g00867 [Theileria parva strain Muguga]EAN32221.1 hypothetical protein TpMuguga_04g00867 [Theileria parva strain Muguga]|eukprot:XP_764504.1 hypothetical protein [Theileria parva strain Muguga]